MHTKTTTYLCLHSVKVCTPGVPGFKPAGATTRISYLSSAGGSMRTSRRLWKSMVNLDMPSPSQPVISKSQILPSSSWRGEALQHHHQASGGILCLTSGISLNDILLPGINLYPLITDVVLFFRTHVIGMSADISKMFREVGLHPDDRDLHRFLQPGLREKGITDMRMTRVSGRRASPTCG